MLKRSRVGFLFGAFVALIVPVASLVVGYAWKAGLIHLDVDAQGMVGINVVELAEIVLGPLGIVIGGRSIGARGGLAWFVVIVVAAPLVALLWLIGRLYLSSAAGFPA